MDTPIAIATLQACVLSGVSNIIGQYITCLQNEKPFHFGFAHLTHFVLFTFLSCPPNYIWQSWLEATYPAYTESLTTLEKERLVDHAVIGRTTGHDLTTKNQKGAPSGDANEAAKKEHTKNSAPASANPKRLNLRNTLIKFALDQTLGAAVNTVVFLGGIALIRGESWSVAWSEVQNKFWPLVFAGQKLWPAVSIINFAFIPLKHRTLFGSIVGLFWGVYLSLVSHA